MESEIGRFCEDTALLIVSVAWIYLLTQLFLDLHSFYHDTIERHKNRMKNLREENEKYKLRLGVAKKESCKKEESCKLGKRFMALISAHKKSEAQRNEALSKLVRHTLTVVDNNLCSDDPKTVVERLVSKLDHQETDSHQTNTVDGFEIPPQELVDFSSADPLRDVQTYLEEDGPSIDGGLGSDGGDVLVSEESNGTEKDLKPKIANSLPYKEKVQASSSEMVNDATLDHDNVDELKESDWDWVLI